MMTVYVIQTGRTAWEEESRVEPTSGAPMTEQGVLDVLDAAKEMADKDIKAVFACTAGETERQTAELVTKTLGVKVRDMNELHSLDYGLWQGLTMDEIKRRQPKAYRQWTTDPASTCPPEGETLAEAQDRLRCALKDILKRQKNGSVLLVLRPMLVGLFKCLAQGAAMTDFWRQVDETFGWGSYEVDEKTL